MDLLNSLQHLVLEEIKSYLGEHPESMHNLRVGGWVRLKAYSRIQGGWVGCYRSKLTYPNNMACSTNRISHLSENNCMSIFIVFELLLSIVFIEDEIDT